MCNLSLSWRQDSSIKVWMDNKRDLWSPGGTCTHSLPNTPWRRCIPASQRTLCVRPMKYTPHYIWTPLIIYTTLPHWHKKRLRARKIKGNICCECVTEKLDATRLNLRTRQLLAPGRCETEFCESVTVQYCHLMVERVLHKKKKKVTAQVHKVSTGVWGCSSSPKMHYTNQRGSKASSDSSNSAAAAQLGQKRHWHLG